MASVNKVFLLGHLGRDPELRYTSKGEAVCNFSMATSMKWKNKVSGELEEQTEWHRVTVFGQLGENAAKHLKKGSQVFIEGRLQTRKWTDKDGIDRYVTEIIAARMELFGEKKSDVENFGNGRGKNSRQSHGKNKYQSAKDGSDFDF
jgi:single-strand DNA-binding protein